MPQVKEHDALPQQCSAEDLTPCKVKRTSRDYKVHINLFNIDREEFKTTKPEEEECGLFLLSSSKKDITNHDQSVRGPFPYLSSLHHIHTSADPTETRNKEIPPI